MTKQVTVKNLIIENFGFTELNVRVFELGQGKPKIAILNGLHGLERTGAYLMSRLIPKLKLKKGLVSFIPFANPTSTLKNTRLTPEDLQDLNRIFPGNAHGSLSFRLTDVLFNYLKDFDLVIDIHTFPKMQMPLVGVYLASTPPKQKERLLKIIRLLAPDFIWKLDTATDEKNKGGSLIQAMQDGGKLAFSLEVPDIELITPSQETQILAGLQNILGFFLDGKEITVKEDIPVITRIPTFSPTSGFFVPEAQVKQQVKKGAVLGKIIDLENFRQLPVTSPINGPVVFILNKTYVLPGERVAIIGQAVEKEKI